MENEIILRKAKHGDSASFEALVTLHEQTVWRVCWQMMGNVHDAEDAAQATMLKAWQSLGTFEGNSSLSTWLYRIAVNVCLDELGRIKRRPVPVDEIPEYPSEERNSTSAEQEVLRKEGKEELREALDSLTEDQKVPLVLSAIEGKSYDEISDLLNVPAGTVKSRISRARAQLKKVFLQNHDH